MPCLRSGTGIVEGGCVGCPKKMIPIKCSVSSLTPAASMSLDAGTPMAPVSHLDANPSEARLNMKLPHAAATARAQRGNALTQSAPEASDPKGPAWAPKTHAKAHGPLACYRPRSCAGERALLDGTRGSRVVLEGLDIPLRLARRGHHRHHQPARDAFQELSLAFVELEDLLLRLGPEQAEAPRLVEKVVGRVDRGPECSKHRRHRNLALELDDGAPIPRDDLLHQLLLGRHVQVDGDA